MPLRRRKSRRTRHKKRPSMRSLSKKIARVSLRDRPVYKVYDDLLNDNNYVAGVPIPVAAAISYKYLGYLYGISSPVAMQMGAGVFEGDVQGNVINAVSLTIRGSIYLPASPDASNQIRIIVFWDHYFSYITSTSAIVINFPTTNTQVLGSFNGVNPTALAPSIYSGYNVCMVGKQSRFKPLWDRTFHLSSTGNQTVRIHKKIRLHKKIQFGTIGAIGSGGVPTQNVGLAMLSDSVVAPSPLISLQMRLCYST